MRTPKSRPKTVAEYIAAAPKEARAKLREMRACVRAAAPGAVEGLKWQMPVYSHRRILVMFAAFKHHISLFPTAAAVKAFAKELSTFKTTKGSIHFPLDKPLPRALIRKIVKFRVRDSFEMDGKWRT